MKLQMMKYFLIFLLLSFKIIAQNSKNHLFYENSVTVLQNNKDFIPFKNLENQSIAYLKIGNIETDIFYSHLKKYTKITEIFVQNNFDFTQLKPFNSVIISIFKENLKFEEIQLIQEIAKNNCVIIDVFSNLDTVKKINEIKNINTLIYSIDKTELAQIISSEIIFGAIDSKGKINFLTNKKTKNIGIFTKSLNRLGFSIPENVGMNSEKLNEIDKIANYTIDQKIAPGVQVLVARKGKIIYHKTFGFHTYEKLQKVQEDDLYDVASLTKIIASMPLIIQNFDQKKYTLENTLGELLPDFKNSNKENITIKELLSHYGKLQAWIAFYKSTLDLNKKPLEKYYSKIPKENFTTKVAENLFMRNDYKDSIIKTIIDSKLIEKQEYKYSDFTFIIMQEFLEKIGKNNLDELTKQHFFNSLGMNNSTFNPLNTFEKNRIIPTEYDTYYRNQTLQGNVHDMAAAMKGGISGHAGLFSTALDIAKMMQLYLQKGSYGDKTYFSAETFDIFNTCYFCSEGNPRVLGFDKKRENGSTTNEVSSESFGHTGFTGTMTWADPENETIFVFLSNRTYPEIIENNLVKEKIREKVQQIIYQAIE